MECNENSLQALELLMNEFFNNATSNERKHEIEIVLSKFSQKNDIWKPCLYYLTHTTNHFVSMFCLNTIEQNVINKFWDGLSSEERATIRVTLFQIILTNQRTIPNFIRNKFVKLIVNIARHSWPHFYPDFLNSILSLGQNPETVPLCIVFLQMTSEELISSRAELPYNRKIELKKLLLHEVPSILNILTGILESIVEKARLRHLEGVIEEVRHCSTTTPPPSPTRGNQSLSPSNHRFGADSFINSMYHSLNSGKGDPNFGKVFVSLQPLDFESESVASLCLSCLSQYFSWIPVSSLVQPQLLRVIFVFAAFGAHPESTKSRSNFQEPAESYYSPLSMSVSALSAINEIFCRNGVSVDCEGFFLQTFKSAFYILHRLVLSSSTQGSCYMESLENEYINKFTEFLRLIVSFHLKRFEIKEQFAVLEFLNLLLRYTFIQRNLEAYNSCIEIWSIFLEELNAEYCFDDNKGSEKLLKYKEALLTLVRGVLHKMQLRFNQDELENLDHELTNESCYVDDDSCSLLGDLPLNESLTEWQEFLSMNLEILAKVADLFPDEVFDILYESFLDASKVYLELQSRIVEEGNRRSLRLASSPDYKSLHCALRDLSSFLQGIGRLSLIFLGDNLSNHSSVALQVITKIIEIAKYGNAIKLFHGKIDVGALLQDFIEVHAQVLSTLKAWTHWLSQLYGQQFVQVLTSGGSPLVRGETRHVHQYQDTCHSINKQLLLIAAEVIHCETPSIIVNCAIQLLSSLSILVRSPVALDLSPIQDLYVKVLSFPFQMKSGLCRALVNFLLLPWPSFISDHKSDVRKQHLVAFLHSLTKDFYSSNVVLENGNSSVCMEKMCETLVIIRIQIDELNGTDKNSRELYYQCLKEFIDHIVRVFSTLVNKPDISREVLALFVVVVQVLRNQIGTPKLVSFFQSLIGIFTDSVSVYLDLCATDSNAVKALDRYLKLLELIVCEPGSAFQRIIPNVISLCLEQMYPALSQKSIPELRERIFKIMHCLLDRNWKYFFKSSVQSSLGSNGWDSCDNEAQFILMMQAYGQSFMESDINLFRMNLTALESLNHKYKLYHRGVFKNSMLVHFITALMQILIQRTHDIFQEEIGIAIYNMAAVDFDGFFSAFLPQFLYQFEGVTDDERMTLKQNFKLENDLPSFTQNNQRFVNDLRFYRNFHENLKFVGFSACC